MLVYVSGAVCLKKKGRETVENEPHGRRPRASVRGENSDRVDALIQENRISSQSVAKQTLNITRHFSKAQ